MRKKWIGNYLGICTIVVLVISVLATLVFTKPEISNVLAKEEFESIYKKTTIDFVVPGPSEEQLSALKNYDTGIKTISPYYETNTNVTVGSKASKGTSIIFSVSTDINDTPYCEARIIEGQYAVPGTAVIDKEYAISNNCALGMTLTINISGKDLEFEIVGLAENNTSYKDGTVALYLTEEMSDFFTNNGIRYSAAYVAASDYSKCKEYLRTQYKPESRLKDRTAFESDEAYNKHLQNFNDADWSKEVTVYAENYDSFAVKYQNVESSVTSKAIISAILAAVLTLVLNVIMLKKENLKKFFKSYVVKKNGSKSEVRTFYCRGALWIFAVYLISIVGGYIYLVNTMKISLNSIVSIIPLASMGSVLVATIVCILVILVSVKRNYSAQGRD